MIFPAADTTPTAGGHLVYVVIVEPGVIRTNIVDGLVFEKKSQDPDSPYSQIMQKIATGF
jgi:hypothetical protein